MSVHVVIKAGRATENGVFSLQQNSSLASVTFDIQDALDKANNSFVLQAVHTYSGLTQVQNALLTYDAETGFHTWDVDPMDVAETGTLLLEIYESDGQSVQKHPSGRGTSLVCLVEDSSRPEIYRQVQQWVADLGQEKTAVMALLAPYGDSSAFYDQVRAYQTSSASYATAPAGTPVTGVDGEPVANTYSNKAYADFVAAVMSLEDTTAQPTGADGQPSGLHVIGRVMAVITEALTGNGGVSNLNGAGNLFEKAMPVLVGEAEAAQTGAQVARTQAEAQATAAANSAAQAGLTGGSFSDTTARDAAHPTPATGLRVFLYNATSRVYDEQEYNGSAWTTTGRTLYDALKLEKSLGRLGAMAELHPWVANAAVAGTALLGNDTREVLEQKILRGIPEIEVFNAQTGETYQLDRIRLEMSGAGINSNFIAFKRASDGLIVAQYRSETAFTYTDDTTLIEDLDIPEANASGVSFRISLRPGVFTTNSANSGLEYEVSQTAHSRDDIPTVQSPRRPLGVHYDRSLLTLVGGNDGSETTLDVAAYGTGGCSLVQHLRRFVNAGISLDAWCLDATYERRRHSRYGYTDLSENAITRANSAWTFALEQTGGWSNKADNTIGEQAHGYETHSYATGVPALTAGDLRAIVWRLDGKEITVNAALKTEGRVLTGHLRTYLLDPDSGLVIGLRNRLLKLRALPLGGLGIEQWHRFTPINAAMLEGVASPQAVVNFNTQQVIMAMLPAMRRGTVVLSPGSESGRQITQWGTMDGNHRGKVYNVSAYSTDNTLDVVQRERGVSQFELWGDEVSMRMRTLPPVHHNQGYIAPNQGLGYIKLDSYEYNKAYHIHSVNGGSLILYGSSGQFWEQYVEYEIDSLRGA